MLVMVMYEPDETCTDPKDHAQTGRRHGDVMDDDVLVVWRKTVGNPDADGHIEYHVVGMGVFENIQVAPFRKAMRKMGVDV